IVPTRAIQLMQRAVDKDDVVQLAARENDLMVRTSRCMIYSRLVEGRYPNWRQVFPSREGAVQIDLTVGPLYAALRQAAIVADQESRGIDFTFSEGTLRMEANTAEIGESSVDLPINYSGESVTLTMDHRYVSDFCKVLDAEGAMVMEIDGAAAPVLLSTEDGYSYVIMPMSRK
ncbi:MAG: DNA polymerase III subunit beta, partial [Planctomycetota bacterium]